MRVIFPNFLRSVQITGMSFVLGLIGVTLAHVGGRYFFNKPLIGSVELSSLLVVTIVFLTAPYDFLIDRHIKITTLLQRLPRLSSLIIGIITGVLSLILLFFGALITFRHAFEMQKNPQTTDILNIPLHPFLYIVAGGWFMAFLAQSIYLKELFFPNCKRKGEGDVP